MRYSAAGKSVATGGINQGPYAFGSLFFNKFIPNGKTFYCPSVLSGQYWYGYYEDVGFPWPSALTTSSGNPYVRCSYSYYAQSKTLDPNPSATYSFPNLPVQNYSSQTFTSPNPSDPQNTINTLVPLKTTEVDQNKCIVADTLDNWNNILHKMGSAPKGLNVLFSDAHVNWENIKGNNKKNSYQPFDPNLWKPDPLNNNVPSLDPEAFRIVVNQFLP
jgi:hypothetical protein